MMFDIFPNFSEKHMPAEPAREEIVPTLNEQVQTSSSSDQSKLSEVAQALMKLSDWVYLVKAGGTPVQLEVVEEIYRQLVNILDMEDVIVLQSSGVGNYERQMVVGIRHTDDPAVIDHVYNTIRPGYLFHDQLIRAQEVIMYVD